MKISDIEILEINTGITIISKPWRPVIIRINTDEGISGLGEVGLAYGVGQSAAAGMAKNLAEEYLIGADPMKMESIWNDMFQTTFWAKGGGSIVFGGMSAVNTGLLDIKGKALDTPIYQLLGGKTNEKLRTYASQIQFGWSEELENLGTPQQYAEAAKKAVDEGYDCVKLDPIYYKRDGSPMGYQGNVLTHEKLEEFYQRVKTVREEVGSDVDIIIENHSNLSVPVAIQLGKKLEELNCHYFEEPVNYLNVELQEKVSNNVEIPMAAGERIYTRWGYRPYLEKGLLDVIQPDIGLAGGIAETKKICDLAHVYDASVQVHVCGSPVATAAALQLEAVIPNFIIHEHHTINLKEGNKKILKQDLQPKNGYFEIPDDPGLGVELNEEIISESSHTVVE